jgi:AcrR family transcriptional regulator
MGTARERILDAAEDLITSGHVPPALDAVVAAGVSKGGLLYHFDEQSLLRALVTQAVQRFDERLTAAAAEGLMAEAWLRLSVPAPGERTLYRAMTSMMRCWSRQVPALRRGHTIHSSPGSGESRQQRIDEVDLARFLRHPQRCACGVALVCRPPHSPQAVAERRRHPKTVGQYQLYPGDC